MKKSNKTIVLMILIILIIIGGYFVYQNLITKDINYGDYTIYKETMANVEDYDSSNVIEGYKGGDRAYYINGKISSFNDKGLTVIIYNLYNKDNKVIGTAKAVINEVKKNKKYDFKAIGIVDSNKITEISHYKFKEIKEK